MLIVHHQVAGGQRQRVDGVAAFGRQPLALDGRHPAAGQVRFGDHHQVGARYDHAVVQRTLEHPDHTLLGRRTGFQHGGGGVEVGQSLHHPMSGPGPGRDHHGVAAGRDVRAQHREDAVDVMLMPASRRRRPDLEFQRRLVGQLAQAPPGMAGPGRRGVHVVQLGEPRSAELRDVDGRVGAQRRDGPRRLEEFAARLDQVGGPAADFLRVTQQHRRALGQLVGEQHVLARPQHREQRLHAVDRDAFGQLGQHVGDAAGDGGFGPGVPGGQGGGPFPHVVGQQQFPAGHRGERVDLQLREWSAGRRPRTSASR